MSQQQSRSQVSFKMDWPASLSVVFLLSSFIFAAWGDLSITIEPQGPVKPGTSIKVLCNVSRGYEDSPVSWVRRTGTLELQIAKNSILESTVVNAGRYILNPVGTASGVINILEIQSVKYEDIAEIGCILLQSTQNIPQYATLSVCSNPESNWCNCIVKQKWADPKCAEEATDASATNKNLKRAVTGLAVCLAIAIAFALVMTILASLDCSARLHKKRQLAEQKAAAQAARNRNPYGESEQLTLDGSMDSDPVSTPSNGNYKGPLIQAEVHLNKSFEKDVDEMEAAPAPYKSGQLPKNVPLLPEEYKEPYRYYKTQKDENADPNKGYYNKEDRNEANRRHLDESKDPNRGYYNTDNVPRNPVSTVAQTYGLHPGYETSRTAHLPPNDHYVNTGSGINIRDFEKSTGNLSTKSDYTTSQIDLQNLGKPSYANSRGAYSEQKPKQYGRQGRQGGYSEPKQLDFSRTNTAEAAEPSGPYISPDTSV